MSTETIKTIICDRCDASVEINITEQAFGARCDWVHVETAVVIPTPMLSQGGGDLKSFDLCPPCFDKFKEFMTDD